jgi:hypothetical protein
MTINDLLFELLIVDLDGTIADNSHRVHLIKEFNPPSIEGLPWDKFYNLCDKDVPLGRSQQGLQILKRHVPAIVYATGRPEMVREKSEKWLSRHNYPIGKLLMRKDDDHRSSNVVKRDMLVQYFGGRVLAVEDETKNIAVFHSLGFAVLRAPECWDVLCNSDEV